MITQTSLQLGRQKHLNADGQCINRNNMPITGILHIWAALYVQQGSVQGKCDPWNYRSYLLSGSTDERVSLVHQRFFLDRTDFPFFSFSSSSLPTNSWAIAQLIHVSVLLKQSSLLFNISFPVRWWKNHKTETFIHIVNIFSNTQYHDSSCPLNVKPVYIFKWT